MTDVKLFMYIQFANVIYYGSQSNRYRLVFDYYSVRNIPEGLIVIYYLCTLSRSYQTATQGIWWMELANDIGNPRDMVCPAKVEYDKRIFAMRVITVEG